VKPSTLKPGQKVVVDSGIGAPREMTFVKRHPGRGYQAALNVFQCDAYRGLDGAGDDGRCHMSDSYAARHISKVLSSGSPH